MNYFYKFLFIFCVLVSQSTFSSTPAAKTAAEKPTEENQPAYKCTIDRGGGFENDKHKFWIYEPNMKLCFADNRYQLKTAFGTFFFESKEFSEVQSYTAKKWNTYIQSKKETTVSGVAFFWRKKAK